MGESTENILVIKYALEAQGNARKGPDLPAAITRVFSAIVDVMEDHMYHATFAVEDRHWWFRNLRAILAQSLWKYLPRTADLAILDAGCGTGRNLAFYREYGRAVGIDRSPTGLSYCTKRGVTNLTMGDVCALPFKDASFDLVNSTDVLYALEPARGPDFVTESCRVLKPGGYMFLNTAAMHIPYSDHDRAVMTRKRYDKGELIELINRTPFELVQLRYWNSILLLPVVAYRAGRRMTETRKRVPRGDLRLPHEVINRLLYRLVRLEWVLAGALPFGTSLFCIARKPGVPFHDRP